LTTELRTAAGQFRKNLKFVAKINKAIDKLFRDFFQRAAAIFQQNKNQLEKLCRKHQKQLKICF